MFSRAKRRDDLPSAIERLLRRHGGLSKKSKKDSDYVEWTTERFDRSTGFNELPEGLRIKLSAVQNASRSKRGTQKARLRNF